MPTITRKIELHLCTEGLTDEQRKAQWGLLYHINDNLYKAANNVSSKLYLDEHVASMVRLKHDGYLSLLNEYEKAKKKADEELIAELRNKVAAAEKEMTEQELAICKYATEMSTDTLAYRFANEIEMKLSATGYARKTTCSAVMWFNSLSKRELPPFTLKTFRVLVRMTTVMLTRRKNSFCATGRTTSCRR